MSWVSSLLSSVCSTRPDWNCMTSCFGGRTEDNRVIVEEGAFTIDTSQNHIQFSNCCNSADYKEQNREAWNTLSEKVVKQCGEEVARIIVDKYFPLNRQGSALKGDMVKELAKEAKEIQQLMKELHQAQLFHEFLLIQAEKTHKATTEVLAQIEQDSLRAKEAQEKAQAAGVFGVSIVQEEKPPDAGTVKKTDQKNPILEQLKTAREKEARPSWRSYLCCAEKVTPISQEYYKSLDRLPEDASAFRKEGANLHPKISSHSHAALPHYEDPFAEGGELADATFGAYFCAPQDSYAYNQNPGGYGGGASYLASEGPVMITHAHHPVKSFGAQSISLHVIDAQGYREKLNEERIKKIISNVPVIEKIAEEKLEQIGKAILETLKEKRQSVIRLPKLENMIMEKLHEEGIHFQVPENYTALAPVLSENLRPAVLVERYKALPKSVPIAEKAAAEEKIEDPEFAILVKN